MRLVLSITVALAISASASASSNMLPYFKAVMSSEALAATLANPVFDGFELKSIDKTLDFRCPGCYQFTVKTEKRAEGKVSKKNVLLVTNLDTTTNTISVMSPER